MRTAEQIINDPPAKNKDERALVAAEIERLRSRIERAEDALHKAPRQRTGNNG